MRKFYGAISLVLTLTSVTAQTIPFSILDEGYLSLLDPGDSLSPSTLLLTDHAKISELAREYIDINNSKYEIKQNIILCGRLKELDNYRVQYYVAENKEGTRYIFAHFVHKSVASNTGQLVIVADSCYETFNFWIDASTWKILDRSNTG